MRVGLLGGTFDPVHYGHLLLAELCREECRLDSVRFLPAGVPPHKMSREISLPASRAAMLDLAVAGNPAFEVDRRELLRRDPCFTVDTLRELRAEMPQTQFVFLLGADSLADFSTWKSPGEILRLADLAVVRRRGEPEPDLTVLGRLGVADWEQRVTKVVGPAVDFSSSEIRQRVATGRSIRYQVPPAVECYLTVHGLYGAARVLGRSTGDR